MADVNVSIQVIPNVPNHQIYPVVDKVIALIEESGVVYEVGPMETTMEGDLDQLLDIVKRVQYLCADEGAERVISIVKIDFSTKGITINEKVEKYRQKEK